MAITASTTGGIRPQDRAGDGWWIAGAILLLGAALAIALALTLGPVERPFGPSYAPALVAGGTNAAPQGYELGRGLVCMQCEPAS